MSYLPPLEELDKDGAIQEAASKVDEHTRASFLRKAGIGVGAMAAGSTILGSVPAIAGAASKAIPASDIAILNFALTLEYLEAEFYAEAKTKGGLHGETLRFAKVVANHENVHVQTLKKVLGTQAVAKPKFNFRDTVTNMAKFQATSDALEATGVHAYLGQAPNIKTPIILITAARIVTVEARHNAWIRDIRFSGGTTSPTTPAPAPFDDGFSKAKILAIVAGTKFIVG